MRPDRFSGLEPGLAGLLLPIAEAEFPEQVMALAWWPDDRRAVGLAVLALMAELKAIPAKVTDPTLGAVRFAFWREVAGEAAAGTALAHPVAQGLAVVWPHIAPLTHECITALIDAGEEARPDTEGASAPGPSALYARGFALLAQVAGSREIEAMEALGRTLGDMVLLQDKGAAKEAWVNALKAVLPFTTEAAPIGGAAKLEAQRHLKRTPSPLRQRLSLLGTILRGR